MDSIKHKIREYYLGQLSAQEEEALEMRYFKDQQLLVRLLEVKDELIRAYISDQLIEEERARFESHFLKSQRRRAEVEVFRALENPKQASSTTTASIKRWQNLWRAVTGIAHLRIYAVAVSTIVIAFSLWFFLTSGSQQPKLTPKPTDLSVRRESRSSPQREAESLGPVTTERTLPPTKEAPSNELVVALLAPGHLRGGTIKQIELPAKSKWLRARLVIEEPGKFNRYVVSLRTSSGTEVWRRGGVRQSLERDVEVVAVDLPTAKLKEGEYGLHLSGQEQNQELTEVGIYPFRISRK